MNLFIEEADKVLLSKMLVVNPIESGFRALSDQIGFPIDQVTFWTDVFLFQIEHTLSLLLFSLQVRYITLLFLCYPVAWVFRYALHPSHTRVATRHVFSAAVGIAMGVMCFGWWESKGG